MLPHYGLTRLDNRCAGTYPGPGGAGGAVGTIVGTSTVTRPHRT